MTDDSPLPVFAPEEAAERIGGDHELLQYLVQMYLAEHDGYVASVEAPFAAQDWVTFARAVHTLKGVLATLSANRAHAVAERLDRAVKAGETAGYADLLARLRGELNTLADALRRYPTG